MSVEKPARILTPRGRPGQPKPRVDRDARRQAVLDAAAAVFAERGLQAATMQDVAVAAGMAKVLIYRLYPSRTALIDALFGQILGEVREAASRPWGGYGSSLAALVEMARARPTPFLLLLRDARAVPEAAPWGEAFETLLASLIEPFIAPPADASPEARQACRHAARAFVPFLIAAWIGGIEGQDGLSDPVRARWFGEVFRGWRTATRDALGLPSAAEPSVLTS